MKSLDLNIYPPDIPNKPRLQQQNIVLLRKSCKIELQQASTGLLGRYCTKQTQRLNIGLWSKEYRKKSPDWSNILLDKYRNRISQMCSDIDLLDIFYRLKLLDQNIRRQDKSSKMICL